MAEVKGAGGEAGKFVLAKELESTIKAGGSVIVAAETGSEQGVVDEFAELGRRIAGGTGECGGSGEAGGGALGKGEQRSGWSRGSGGGARSSGGGIALGEFTEEFGEERGGLGKLQGEAKVEGGGEIDDALEGEALIEGDLILGAPEKDGGGVVLLGGPEGGGLVKLAHGEFAPRVGLGMDTLGAGEDDAGASFVALGAADVGEIGHALGSRENEGGTHGLGASGIVDSDIAGFDAPVAEEAGQGFAKSRITRTQFLEPGDLDKIGQRLPIELLMDFFGENSGAAGAEIPDYVGPKLAQGAQHGLGRATDTDERGGAGSRRDAGVGGR